MLEGADLIARFGLKSFSNLINIMILIEFLNKQKHFSDRFNY